MSACASANVVFLGSFALRFLLFAFIARLLFLGSKVLDIDMRLSELRVEFLGIRFRLLVVGFHHDCVASLKSFRQAGDLSDFRVCGMVAMCF
jgi:hypothetical protein